MAITNRKVETRWSIWAFLAVFSMFCPINGDFTSYHLHNYLDHSVSPCSDFYSHVCSRGMHENETALHKSEQFYRDLAEKLNSRSRNNPIMNDIASARESKNCTFDSESYMSSLYKRCGSRFDCFLEEFYYFFEIYNKTFEIEGYSHLAFFAKRVNSTNHTIPRLVNVTSTMIEILINSPEDLNFDESIKLYVNFHDRLFIMSELGRDNASSYFDLGKLRKMEKDLKGAIANRFKETPWLYETDAFHFDHLSQFLTTLEEIHVMTDFDELDADLSYWRNIDRKITEKYFEYSKRSTGCPQFDVMHPFSTLNSELEEKFDSGHNLLIFDRIMDGFLFNAFNRVTTNSIVMHAPTFYPMMWQNSSETTLLAFAATMAHEMFHSFIKNDLPHKSESYIQEANCLISHFNGGCDIWAESGCKSGEHTFSEDGPDVEGLRATYDLLKKLYDNDQLQEMEYKDLGIARDQAFFYAYAVRECTTHEHDHEDPHSANNIRLNAAVSMMPEFTWAFSCKQEDAQYSEESSSCYLFGPLAGSQRGEQSIEETEGNENEEDASGEEINEIETGDEVDENHQSIDGNEEEWNEEEIDAIDYAPRGSEEERGEVEWNQIY